MQSFIKNKYKIGRTLEKGFEQVNGDHIEYLDFVDTILSYLDTRIDTDEKGDFELCSDCNKYSCNSDFEECKMCHKNICCAVKCRYCKTSLSLCML